MSWASRKRATYLGGIFLVFAVLVGVPLAIWLYEAPSCFDRVQNQGETAPDKGGPCTVLDERALSPSSVLWARAFPVRPGAYSAVAYVENSNRDAAVLSVAYRFRLYDESNVLVAERGGSTYIMPGGVTPVFEGSIPTGTRTVTRAFFELIGPAPVWVRAQDPADALVVSNTSIAGIESAPRLTASVANTSVGTILEPQFVAVVFDAAGNAQAASATALPRIAGGAADEIVFTWALPFPSAAGRIDILPATPPEPQR